MQRPDSKTRSRVRPSASRGLSNDSSIRASTGVGIILDGPVDSSAVNLLSDLFGPARLPSRHRRTTSNLSREMTNNELIDEIENQRAFHSGLFEEQDEENVPQRHSHPWFRRRSPWWLIIGTFLAAIAISTTIAPKVELFTKLVCRELRPEYDMITLQVTNVSKPIDWPIGAVTIPRPSEKCQADPGVQKAVATLGATITTVMGVVSCFTAGYWGQFSDRYGRTLILAITVFGVLLTDLTLILVAHFGQNITFGYRFILIAPIAEGLLGGISSGSAAGHAYIADCTNPATRSRYLSLSMGLLFVGIAVGPTIGGLLISKTGDLLSVFYLAASIHFLYLVSMLFIVPESLSKEEMANNRAAHAEEVKRGLEKERRRVSGFWYSCWVTTKKAFFFLKPLTVFLPKKRAGRQKGKNWNLTFLMISYSFVAVILGSYQTKFQYASYTFGWNSQQLGYWLSTAGILRATHLVVVLPLMMKLFNRQPASTPGGGTPATDISETFSISTSIESNPNRPPHTPSFDLFVARASALIETLAYAGAALSTTETMWIIATLSSSFGSGFAPSVQALALELHLEAEEDEASSDSEEALDGGENNHSQQPSTSTTLLVSANATRATVASSSVGKIYGAMSVAQALCSQILGPQIYRLAFVVTIQTWPKGIFWLSSGMIGVTFIGMMLIRLTDPAAEDAERRNGERRDEGMPLLVTDE